MQYIRAIKCVYLTFNYMYLYIICVYRVSHTHTRPSAPAGRRRWGSSSGGTGIGGIYIVCIYAL